MKHTRIENVIDVIYLMCFAGSCADVLYGISEHSIGLMILAVPALALTMIGIKYWPTYTEQRREYLKTMLIGCSLLLPIGIIMIALSDFTHSDKAPVIIGFTLVTALAIANIITIMAEFKHHSLTGNGST